MIPLLFTRTAFCIGARGILRHPSRSPGRVQLLNYRLPALVSFRYSNQEAFVNPFTTI